MRTRHKPNNSWNVCKLKTLTNFHLENCTPKALEELMLADADEKLPLAKRKFLANLAALTPPVVKTAPDILLELVNIRCSNRLYSNTTGAED